MMRHTIRLTAVLTLLASAAQAEPSQAAKVLLDQANYWFSQNRTDDAERAVGRLLRLEPDNPDGLALLAQLQAQRGDKAHAQATLNHLHDLRPDDSRIANVEQAIRVGSIDPQGLAEARRLAQEGHNAEAVSRYQRLFQGTTPPTAMAAEYYETLSGTEGGYDAARDGLAKVAAAAPRDNRLQLAYARLLTYRDQTRTEGAQRLAELAKSPDVAAAASKAWRQALEWMPVDTPTIPAYQAWMAGHPDDAGIAGRMEQARNPPQTPLDVAGKQRNTGFTALNAGKIGEAETAFAAVLAQTPNDPDALGGMGLVRLRQGKTAEARTLLAQAIAADPTHKSRWESALQGASVGDDYAAARTMIQRGQLDAADRQLRAIISSGGDIRGAQMMLADVLVRRGDLAGAEAQYRAVLAHQPNNSDALVGMAQVLNRQGRSGEAEAMLDRAQSSGSGQAVGRIRADALRQQAAATSNADAKEALLRAASAADPNDPWVRLDLARALVASGKRAEARQVMAELTGARSPGVDALRAGAMFAADDDRPADAAALIERLPAGARTADMRRLLAQAARQNDIRSAMAMTAISPMAAREKLLTLAAQPDPDGTNGVAVARAFLQMHNPAGAREALSVAQASTRTPTAAQRIAYAGLLLQAGDDRAAGSLIRSLNDATGLTPDQTASLNRLRAGAAIRASDTLNAQHQQAAAYDVLAPALARDPSNSDLNLAVARLFAGADQPRRALAINQDVLERNPNNLDARKAALDAAIQASDWSRAETLVRDGIAATPDDPRVWAMSAALHQARGNLRLALADLKRAQSLRRQEVGFDNTTMFGRGRDSFQGQADAASMPSGNPFRRNDPDASSIASMSTYASTTDTADPMLQDIDRQMAVVQQSLAPKFTIGPAYRTRTGTSGLDHLDEASVPTQLVSRPLGQGELTLSATPTFLSAGAVPLDVNSQARFGTGAFGLHPTPPSQHAEGVGLAVGYQLGWAKADFGTSPIGFQQTNMLGGLELSPQISDGVHLRVVGERRAVTDSVLSYAGTKDPATGISWGGVTRTRGHAQLEFALRDLNIYVGGGYSSLTGENVIANHEYELGAGGSYPVWRSKDEEVRIGLDLVYFGYEKNTDFFTVGHGGYFSPQSYFATMIPVKYTVRTDDWTWTIGGTLGYQTYNEKSALVFPNNSVFQNALVAEAALVPTPLATSYPGQSSSGPVGGVDASIEYHVNSSFVLGGQASYQHAGNWSETVGRLYGRYIFGGGI